MTQLKAKRLGWTAGFHAAKRSDMESIRPKLGSFELRNAWEKGFREGFRAKKPSKPK